MGNLLRCTALFLMVLLLGCTVLNSPKVDDDLAVAARAFEALSNSNICCIEYEPFPFREAARYDYNYQVPVLSRSYLHVESTVPSSDPYGEKLNDSVIRIVVYDGQQAIFYRHETAGKWEHHAVSSIVNHAILYPSCPKGQPRFRAVDLWAVSCDDFVTQANHPYRIVLEILSMNEKVASYSGTLHVCSLSPK